MHFKIELFSADLKQKRRDLAQTLHQVSQQMGLSYSQLCKMEHGDHLPNMDSFSKAIKWLVTDPNRYFRTGKPIEL